MSPVNIFARAVSIIGHPAIILPLAVILSAAQISTNFNVLLFSAVAVLISGSVIGWSAWKVRRGVWDHIDASNPGERRDLNIALLIIFFTGMLLCFGLGQDLLALGFLSVAFIAGLAICLKSPFKLSHHVAFAVFALFVVGLVNVKIALWGSALVLLLAWSRHHLGRHSLAEILAGLAAGLVSCFIFLSGAAFIS